MALALAIADVDLQTGPQHPWQVVEGGQRRSTVQQFGRADPLQFGRGERVQSLRERRGARQHEQHGDHGHRWDLHGKLLRREDDPLTASGSAGDT